MVGVWATVIACVGERLSDSLFLDELAAGREFFATRGDCHVTLTRPEDALPVSDPQDVRPVDL